MHLPFLILDVTCEYLKYVEISSLHKYHFKILTCNRFKKMVMNKNLCIMLLVLVVTSCYQEHVIESIDEIVYKPYTKTDEPDTTYDYVGTMFTTTNHWL